MKRLAWMTPCTAPSDPCWLSRRDGWRHSRRRSARGGWFHDEWHGEGDWQRVKITAEQCPRISPQFLAEERRALGERWFNQEYRCEFSECLDAVFSWADIQAAMSDDIKPLLLE